MQIDPEDIKTHYKAQTDFLFFCEEILGYKADPDIDYYAFNKPLLELVGFIEKPSKKSQLILNPRETLKSQICTIGYSLWRMVKNPNIRILIYSDSISKAQSFLGGIKFHIEGKAPNSKFRRYFPNWETDPHKGGTYNESRICVSARSHQQKEPSVDTAGIEQSKVGMHYDLIIFDDIVSDVNVTTKDQMDKVHDCYKKSLSLLKRGGEIRIVGTRWHFGDCYGRILDENKETEEFETFITDAEQETEDGKLLYEDIGLTPQWLAAQRRKQGSYLFSCLYRNNPVDDKTAIFKGSDFKFYKPAEDFHKDLYITGTCDPAGEGDDFTAITIVGTDKNKKLYILDAVSKHLKPNQIVDTIIDLHYKWGFRKFATETNFFKGTLEKDLRRAIEENRSNKNFQGFSVEPLVASVKQRNWNRVMALQPFHERGDIHFPNANDPQSINTLSRVYSELAFQMLQFTAGGSKSPHDDLLISLALHTDIIKPGGEPAKEGPPENSAAWLESEHMKTLGSSKLPRKYKQQFIPTFN